MIEICSISLESSPFLCKIKQECGFLSWNLATATLPSTSSSPGVSSSRCFVGATQGLWIMNWVQASGVLYIGAF